MSLNRNVFFNYVRRAPFGNAISQNQVNGLNLFLDEYEAQHFDKKQFAYVLASVFHETAGKFQPIEEMGGIKYLKSKPYYPYYGRGFIQITWLRNYQKYGIDKTPKKALEPKTALHIALDGMIHGKFTGKKLSDYFNETKEDPIGARAIVNGRGDKATLIAGYYKNFLDSLTAAESADKPTEDQEVTPDDNAQGPVPQASLLSDPLAQAGTGMTALAAGTSIWNSVNNPYALGALLAVLLVAGIGGYFLYQRHLNKRV